MALHCAEQVLGDRRRVWSPHNERSFEWMSSYLHESLGFADASIRGRLLSVERSSWRGRWLTVIGGTRFEIGCHLLCGRLCNWIADDFQPVPQTIE